MSTLPFVTVDVFTDKRFTGNQLAVVEATGTLLSHDDMQAIAREFNYSETVFVYQKDVSQPPRINIYNPVNEMDFAGHPVIGTAHVLFRNLLSGQRPTSEPASKTLVLNTKAGLVPVEYDVSRQLVTARVPHNVHKHSCTASNKAVIATQPLLKLNPAVGAMQETYPIVSLVKGVAYILVDFTRDPALFSALSAGPCVETDLDIDWAPSFTGTMYYQIQNNQTEDNKSVWHLRVRMIAINLEDPACGSGSCTLAVYLALQSGGKNSAHRFHLDQGAEIGRDSKIIVDVVLDDSGSQVSSVSLSGQAVAVMEGKISTA